MSTTTDDIKIFAKNYDKNIHTQINNTINSGIFNGKKIRIMPDTHVGMYCVIGFTAEMGNKINPNIVGVDIGCGVSCTELSGDTPLDLQKIDDFIRKDIPSGMSVFENTKNLNRFKCTEKENYEHMTDLIDKLRCKKDLSGINRLKYSFGTLGGGNHFIEIDEHKETNSKYLVIHTGSRNLGLQVCKHYVDMMKCNKPYENEMKKEIEDTIERCKKKHQNNLIQAEVDKIKRKYNLLYYNTVKYIEGEVFDNYMHDIRIVQGFAKDNRNKIKKTILDTFNLNSYVVYDFESIHNYIDAEDNIVRKGAISAKFGEPVIIPINMADGSIIGIGYGNPDWNYSAPHGAGRLMSRTEANAKVNMNDYIESMKGIYTTSVCINTIDESPMVYKSINEIKDAIVDTVKITRIIKPIYNFKAN